MDDLIIKWSLVYTFCVLIFVAWGIGQLTDNTERIYYIRNGGVYCAQKTITLCGIRLERCASGQIYECLTDVNYEDVHEQK